MKKNIFNIKSLNNAYKIALSGIALLATTSCAILVKEISNQESSSRIINISGRQRMLSQNIAKNILLLNNNFSAEIKEESWQELSKNYNSWNKAHHALQYGDASLDIPRIELSPVIKNYFREINPYYIVIEKMCQNVLSDKNNQKLVQDDLEKLLKNEKLFLSLMDKITFEFDAESKKEVIKGEKYEIFFWVLTLITLLIEAFFIFKPIIAIADKNILDNKNLNHELMQVIKKKEENDIKLLEEQGNSVKLMIMAEEEERKRIATDLHDSLGQMVLSFKMNLIKLGDNKVFEGENKIIYTHLLDSTNVIANEIRAISYNLMPATLSEFGIYTCIEQYVLQVQKSSTAKIIFVHDNKENIQIEPIKEILIYRVSQELLNNAIKHAFASEIIIQLLYHEDTITLMFEDDGVGFDFDQKLMKATAKNTGHGLRNLKTRLQSIGATLNIDTTKEFGTTTIIQIPYTI
jgi:signal transduction histidine kinase